MNSQNLKF